LWQNVEHITLCILLLTTFAFAAEHGSQMKAFVLSGGEVDKNKLHADLLWDAGPGGEEDAGSRSSFGNSENDDDSDSDWDRYSESDEVSSSTNSRGTGDTVPCGEDHSSTGGRRKEKSLFGVADKRNPMGLKCVLPSPLSLATG
jgi:hypothetical protein